MLNNEDKNKIFNDLKKELSETTVPESNTNAPAEKIDSEQKPSFKKKKKNKNKNKFNKQPNFDFRTEEEKIKDEAIEKLYNSTEFLDFKESILSDPNKRMFLIEQLPALRSNGYTKITNDEFLELKMNHPQLKAFVVDPNYDEISLGKSGVCYFIRPLYKEEYQEFLQKVGDYTSNLKEFQLFCLMNCVMHPKLEEEEIIKMPAGRSLSMYHIIKEMSDLNKKFQILEV
jgi:hypothetical protein